MEEHIPNTERRALHVSLGVMIFFAILIFIPGLIGIDGMDGGYAISFLSIFLAVSAGITVVLFWGRARDFDRLLNRSSLLAVWNYDESAWESFNEFDRQAYTQENQQKLLLTAVISVVIGAAFWIFDPEAGKIVALILAGVLILLAAVAYGVPWLMYWQRRTGPRQVWIGREAALIGRVFHTWKGFGGRLEGAEIQDGALIISYSTPSRIGRELTTLRLPIPLGKAGEAEHILEALAHPAPVS